MKDPPPAVFAVNADVSGVDTVLYCWVENADFLGTRSDLWQAILQEVNRDNGLTLSLPRQQISLTEQA